MNNLKNDYLSLKSKKLFFGKHLHRRIAFE